MKSIHKCAPCAASLLLFLMCATALGLSGQPQSPSLFAASAVREALKENGALPEMTTTTYTSKEVREMVPRCLDRRLLSGVQSVSGHDFRFHSSGPTLQFGVIVLEYRSSVVVKQMMAIVEPLGAFRTVVLTRYSAFSLGRLLVINYSETGDPRIVKTIGNLSSDFARASTDGTVWGEPESVIAPK